MSRQLQIKVKSSNVKHFILILKRHAIIKTYDSISLLLYKLFLIECYFSFFGNAVLDEYRVWISQSAKETLFSIKIETTVFYNRFMYNLHNYFNLHVCLSLRRRRRRRRRHVPLSNFQFLQAYDKVSPIKVGW